MSNKILFVFEGERTEKLIINSLTKFFVNENTTVQFAFCADIYQLYNKLYNDDDLDTFSILKKRPQNGSILDGYSRNDFAEIYLFFDYDGHATNANDDTIKSMLGFFNEETEFGKLYMSYPMVESIKHIPNEIDFMNLKVEAKVNIKYKKQVDNEADNRLKNFGSYSKMNWIYVIESHLKKMNFVVNNKFLIPSVLISQINIFTNQLKKFISVDSTIAVLSGFPSFVFDYYGVTKTTAFLKEE